MPFEELRRDKDIEDACLIRDRKKDDSGGGARSLFAACLGDSGGLTVSGIVTVFLVPSGSIDASRLVGNKEGL